MIDTKRFVRNPKLNEYPEKILEIMRNAPMSYSILAVMEYRLGESASHIYRKYKQWIKEQNDE